MRKAARDRTLRTPAAIVGIVAALGLSAVAGPAAAAIPPQDLAFITASGTPLVPEPGGWRRAVTIRESGEVAGRPGNRHTVTVSVYTTGGISRDFYGRVEIQDEECDPAGSCRAVAAVAGSAPYVTPIPPVSADGSVELTFTVPAANLRSALPDGPTEFADVEVDLTVTPVGWRPRPPLSTANGDYVYRYVTHQSDELTARRVVSGQEVTATGTAAGVRAAEVIEGQWEDTDLGEAFPGRYLARPVGTAGLAPYVPPTRNGSFLHPSELGLGTDHGELPVGTSLVTSTGYRLPGNYYEIWLQAIVRREPGAPAAGTASTREGPFWLVLATFQCPPDQPGAPCTPLRTVNVSGTTPTEYRLWRDGRIRMATDLHVTSTDGGQTTDRGTLRALVEVAPAGLGLPTRAGTVYRDTGTWRIRSHVAFRDVAGTFLVGGQRVQAPLVSSLRYERQGTL